jgi:hypothetical protein
MEDTESENSPPSTGVTAVPGGSSLLRLYLEASLPGSESWVQRRVVQLQFLDERAVRWRVSIDFIVPDAAPTVTLGGVSYRLIPLTLLPKGDLADFDLRDESGNALWLPTALHTSKLLAKGLLGIARQVLGGSPTPAGLKEILRSIVSEDPGCKKHREAWEPFEASREKIEAKVESVKLAEDQKNGHYSSTDLISRKIRKSRERVKAADAAWERIPAEIGQAAERLMNDEGFGGQLSDLAENYLLCVGVSDPAGQRRVIKISWERPIIFGAARKFREWAAKSIGWRHWEARTYIGASGGSHHLEVVSPPGVDIVRMKARPTGHPETGAEVITAEGRVPHVHLHVPSWRVDRYEAIAYMRIRPAGWLSAAWLATLVITVTMLVGWLRLQGGVPGSGEAATAATVLLPLLAGIVAWLIRPGEHPLAAKMLRFVRLLMFCEVVVVLIGTGNLVLYSCASTDSHVLWLCLFAVSALVGILITVSVLLPLDTRADRLDCPGKGISRLTEGGGGWGIRLAASAMPTRSAFRRLTGDVTRTTTRGPCRCGGA